MTKIFIIITSVFVFLGVFFTLLGAKGFFFPKLNKNTDPVKQKESGKLLLKVGLVCLVMSGLIAMLLNLTKGVTHEDLNSESWYCTTDINTLYKTVTRVEFSGTETGVVEAYETEGKGVWDKSCTTRGIYKLSDDGTLSISGLSNNNCPWMSRLNGVYKQESSKKFSNNGITIEYF